MLERKTYFCKRTRMASHLMELGFSPYLITPDRDNPVFNVYLFSATPELYEAVIDYTSGKNNIKKEGHNGGKREESI